LIFGKLGVLYGTRGGLSLQEADETDVLAAVAAGLARLNASRNELRPSADFLVGLGCIAT
jgi:hypothetical protein